MLNLNLSDGTCGDAFAGPFERTLWQNTFEDLTHTARSTYCSLQNRSSPCTNHSNSRRGGKHRGRVPGHLAEALATVSFREHPRATAGEHGDWAELAFLLDRKPDSVIEIHAATSLPWVLRAMDPLHADFERTDPLK